ncbi:MAG: hypothetical protein H6909_02015 [Rickettsiaceae bacterium]|nr:hypothetical protein [Rickettsiaceae bacterium]
MRLSKLLLAFIFIWGALETTIAIPKSLPVPRFVTIKFNEVNVRVGPDKNFPITWVFIKAKEPVEIIAEYEQWRKIVDIEGEGGWVHANVLSGKRSVIINSKHEVNLLLNNNATNNQIIAYLKPNLRCELSKCNKELCKVTCKGITGWVLRKYLWGIYPEEWT